MTARGWQPLLADGVRAPQSALDALDEAVARLPDARLLAVRVLTADGPSTRYGEGWPELFDKARVVRATADRVVAVRAVRAGCLLVRDDVRMRHGVPPSGRWGADLAWSARVLRGGGYLVTDAFGHTCSRDLGRATQVFGHLRLLAQPGLTTVERLWLAYRLPRRLAGRRP